MSFHFQITYRQIDVKLRILRHLHRNLSTYFDVLHLFPEGILLRDTLYIEHTSFLLFSSTSTLRVGSRDQRTLILLDTDLSFSTSEPKEVVT